MGRGKQLSQSEIDHVLQLKEQNFKISQIAKTIERSRTVIESLLKDPLNYGLSKKAKKRNNEVIGNDDGAPAVQNSIQVIEIPNGANSNVSPQKQKKLSSALSTPAKASKSVNQSNDKIKPIKQNGVGKAASTKEKSKLKANKGKVAKNKPKKLNKAKNTIKFKMSFNRKKKSGKKSGN